ASPPQWSCRPLSPDEREHLSADNRKQRRGPKPAAKFPFEELKVNECFEIHATDATRAYNTASILSRYSNKEFVSITKTEDRKVVIARIL
ncbi:MAG: hypothetical protein ACYTGH_21685, partial [Planctomycetota bacterium]